MATIFHTQRGQATKQLNLDSPEGQALLAQVKGNSLIGAYNNNWRQRRVEVYSHPIDPALVISIGYGKGEALGYIYVCEEALSAYQGRINNRDWSDYN